MLTIDGIGRTLGDNKPILRGLGIISYHDHNETCRLRAFNDERFLETNVKLLADGRGLTWGFSFEESEVVRF